MKYIVFIIIAIMLLVAFWMKSNKPKPGKIPSVTITESDKGVTPTAEQAVRKVSAIPMILSITSPDDMSLVTSATVQVKGKTVPKADVFVNESETTADANGDFDVHVTLDEGDNYIIIVASDADGNAVEKELTVTYNPNE